jgi:hypothetical protein
MIFRRYQRRDFGEDVPDADNDCTDSIDQNDASYNLLIKPKESLFRRIFNLDNHSVLTPQTSRISRQTVVFICMKYMFPLQKS